MTERADQLHYDNAPAHSTVLVQVFFLGGGGLSPPLQPRFVSLRLLAFPKAKIAVECEEICECDSHTVHKLSQRLLTADWLAPRESDCSRMDSKVSSDRLPSYIKATIPLLKIFKLAGYFPDSPCLYVPYILESKPHYFYSIRCLKNQMRIRIACGLDSRSWAVFWKKKW